MGEISKKDNIFCSKCRKTLRRQEFYKSNNLEKYPDGGTIPTCKKCMTARVNNWDPNTFLWILQECDVPYVPKEWNKILANYAQDPKKVKGTTIIGRYLSKMKLIQYKNWRWKDTEYLQELDAKEIQESLEKQGKDRQEIDKVLREMRFELPEGGVQEPDYMVSPTPMTPDAPIPEENHTIISFEQNDETPDELGLTEEDVTHLRLRWGKAYKPSEWVQLEQYYNDFFESYDIQTAGHKDNLKKLAKTSLKLDQLIDIGDIDGAQKMQKMYDSLMKQGKFTAVQNKTNDGEAVNSVAELVMMCEKDGFIPRYYIDQPKDKVDRVLQDLQNYTHSLITEETNIGNLIENAVKQIEEDKIKEAKNNDSDYATEEDILEDELFSEDQSYLTEEGYVEFRNFEEDLKNKDDETLVDLMGGGK